MTMPKRNSRRCLLATMTLLTWTAATLARAEENKQPAPTAEAPAPSAPAALGAPPAAAACLDAFHMADGWLRTWSVPEGEQDIDPPGTEGVCVTLRLSGASGRLLARVSLVGETATRGKLLWLAFKQARQEAEPRLGLEKDASREQRLAEITARVLLDIQFAGEPVPVSGDAMDAVAIQINPGVDGVLARVRGEKEDRNEAVFPAAQLSMNLNPVKALEAAVGALKLPQAGIGELRTKHSLALYRFRARHLAQLGPGEPPEFLFRGGRVVPISEMNGPGLRELAGRCAAHIQSHAWRGGEPLGLKGNYVPLTDVYAPPVASPREQGVAVLALLRFSATPGVAATDADAARAVGVEVLDKLTQVVKPEADPAARAVDSAAWCIALAELDRAQVGVAPEVRQRLDAFKARAGATLARAFGASGWEASVTPGERAMVACALAVGAKDGASRETAANAVRDLFKNTAPGELVALMPWLAWGELALPNAADPVPAGEALRQLRATCGQFRLTDEQVGADSPDFVGGIVFGKSAAPLPTWQTARALPALGTMLGDKRLTNDDEVPAELLALTASLRFLRQLQVDKPVTHMFRDPSRAMGGVRAALWDQTVSLDATSMTLLAACEVLRAADARAR